MNDFAVTKRQICDAAARMGCDRIERLTRK